MSGQLQVALGQYSDRGRKQVNQDFHGVCIPSEPLLTTKGIAIALADGISSSDVSQVASETAVSGFLEDYYCTPEAWSVKTSAQRVLLATNSWLYAQTRQGRHGHDRDRGYVCTFSAMVIKSTTAHIVHAGDTRIYRLHDTALEQLTEDHRMWVTREKSYLSRALGADAQIEIDYRCLQVEEGDTFLLMSDGVYEYAADRLMAAAVREYAHDLDRAAAAIVSAAHEQGSPDNLTLQIIRVERLPLHGSVELYRSMHGLPFPPELAPGKVLDGYEIIRELHDSSRSHVYLARDREADRRVAIKVPSIDLRGDPAYLERFLMEEWIARRIDSVHVLGCEAARRKRGYLYIVTEFIDGRTLTQWMNDNPQPDIETVRTIVEQIARGLRAFHRQEMLHQDLRPDNIMIDRHGTVKIIDFGSTRVAGITDIATPLAHQEILGTAQYTAPEYFLGEDGTTRSDLFSLGVITYQMLSGRLPYGTEVAKSRTRAAQRNLRYRTVLDAQREIPAWIDGVLRKALHPDPTRRYEALSEFLFDLRHPNRALMSRSRAPLAERDPLLLWKLVSLSLAVLIVLLLGNQHLSG